MINMGTVIGNLTIPVFEGTLGFIYLFFFQWQIRDISGTRENKS